MSVKLFGFHRQSRARKPKHNDIQERTQAQESEPGLGLDFELGLGLDMDFDLGLLLDMEPKPRSPQELQPKSQSQPEARFEPKPQPKSKPEPKPKPKPQLQPQSLPRPKPEPQSKPEPKPQPKPEQESERTQEREHSHRQSQRRGKPQSRARKPKSGRVKAAVISIAVIAILAAGAGAWFYWWWTTEATFDYSLSKLVVLEGESVFANDFLFPAEYMEGVTAEFRSTDMVLSAGHHEIPMILSLGLRTVDATGDLYILTPLDSVTIEFAAPGPDFKPMDFLINADIAGGVPFDIRFLKDPLAPEEYDIGVFFLKLALNGTEFKSLLYVEDTTPPTAMAVNRTVQMSEDVDISDFVTDIYDASPIESVTYVNVPDTFVPGDQIVGIAIEDIYGNREVIEAVLTVLPNEIPPVIEGTRNFESTLGNNIIYRQGVTAYDAFGRELEINVDTHNLDYNEKGSYTVTYWVEDSCGLRTEIDVNVLIVDVDTQWVDDRVDAALAKILKDGMTQVEQAQAIHRWVKSNMSYAATAGPQSVYVGAYQALKTHRGCCFVYYSLSEVMLTRAGIPNMRIERMPGAAPTRHRWNLINPDGLGWYHFDATPTRLNINRLMYMFTDSQAADFARQLRTSNGIPNYFKYDPELYPEIMQ